MVDCKICAHPYCEHAGTQRGIVVSCNGYIEPKKPQTNADRIRAMSDEELAEQLIAYRDDWDDYETHVGCFDKWEDAVKAEVDWLRQPAKDGDNE